MVLTRRQQQNLISKFEKLTVNQKVYNMAAVNYVLRPSKGNINPRNSQGLKIYLQEIRYTEKYTDKLDIAVSNPRDIVEHLLRLAIKYCWGRIAFMVQTSTVNKNIFHQV